jgi:S1-C subfamily serine protease
MCFRTMCNIVAVVFIGICTMSASGRSDRELQDTLPQISELTHLNFTPGDKVESSDYADISYAKSLFVAFNGGTDALSRYREPVLSRGTQGITVFRSVSPAVVVVVVGSIKNQSFDPEGIGTGAIVDAHGYVLTNWHVINGYPGALVFLKPSGQPELTNARAFVTKVVYYDSAVDLALLKFINPPPSLPSLSIGDISQVQVAEDIHIIGHPHGNLWSYSTGVVSQIRDGYSWKYEDGSKHVSKVLQLQTAINPGNSGGPVVDDSGRILGLVAMSEEGQNLDYAIAADVIKHFLFIGMQMSTRGADIATAASVSPEQVFSAKSASGLVVSKTVYKDATLYSIEAADKRRLGLVGTFSDGMVIRAWGPSPSGKFNSWSATLTQGRQFTAVASTGTIEVVSMR